jgi:hypothetical protein
MTKDLLNAEECLKDAHKDLIMANRVADSVESIILMDLIEESNRLLLKTRLLINAMEQKELIEG